MEKKYMDRFKGRYCKIVTREPGEEKANVVSGVLEDIDYKDGFILIDSDQGLGCLSINTIVAIKPGKKRPEQKKIKKDEEAVVGIGTLIIFIAMVLVAAVAASVIIQTQENLQQRAYAVGRQTIRDVSSGIHIIDVNGYTDLAKTKIEYLAISIKPRAGSFDIDLNETLLYLQHDNFTILSLDPIIKAASVSSEGVFHTLNMTALTATKFGVIAIRDSDNSIMLNNGMDRDDIATIVVNVSAALPLTGGLEPGEEINGKIVPEVGASGVFIVDAPSAFTYRVVEI